MTIQNIKLSAFTGVIQGHRLFLLDINNNRNTETTDEISMPGNYTVCLIINCLAIHLAIIGYPAIVGYPAIIDCSVSIGCLAIIGWPANIA